MIMVIPYLIRDFRNNMHNIEKVSFDVPVVRLLFILLVQSISVKVRVSIEMLHIVDISYCYISCYHALPQIMNASASLIYLESIVMFRNLSHRISKSLIDPRSE